MGYPTPIEWTDATWNPIGGCSIASPGCKPCYAQRLAGTRLKNHPLYKGVTSIESGRPVFNGKMTAARIGEDVWTWPLRWRGAREPKLGAGKPSLIFVGDMADLFHENRPLAIVDMVVHTAVKCGHRMYSGRHIHQMLTKRPDVAARYFEAALREGRLIDGCVSLAVAPRNIWIGMSAERQKEFNERWPHLKRLAVLGFTVFVSYEPALGPLKLPSDFLALGRSAQVIAGGVSGNWPWPPHPDWFRGVRDQCATAGVAFFFKQWGEWSPDRMANIEAAFGNTHVAWPDGSIGTGEAALNGGLGISMFRTGKKSAGRLLDGREWNEFPRLAA